MFDDNLISANLWIICPATISTILLVILIIRYTFHWFNRNPSHVDIPNLQKRDFTIEELSQYNGDGADGRIIVAVNGNAFDVTNNGKSFYGKDGPYAMFAGRDVSRALTMFTTDIRTCSGVYDDLSDLTSDEMVRLKEWELQFRERYHLVGRLLSPTEPHHVYERDDEDSADMSNTAAVSTKSKDE